MAVDRVAERVSNGGHNIQEEVIIRRYYKGLSNLFNLFMPVCDSWIVADNSFRKLDVIARKEKFEHVIENTELWDIINKQVNG